jgi:hypothetical protein
MIIFWYMLMILIYWAKTKALKKHGEKVGLEVKAEVAKCMPMTHLKAG